MVRMKGMSASSNVSKPLAHQLISLAKKILIIVAISWISLYLLDVILPSSEAKNVIVQITGTILIIGLSLTVIRTVRRMVKKASNTIGLQLSALISFSIIVFVLVVSTLAAMVVWEINIEAVLIGGGVAAIIIGFAISTLAGNVISGGLMLTTFPAKIGDSIFVVNDNIHGTVAAITFMYTKVISDVGTEYIVPNTAIVQGSIRIIKEARIAENLPFANREHIEIVDGNEKYGGTVTKITPKFTFLSSDSEGKEIILPNASILSGKYVITKDKDQSIPKL
jgi:small conductance mechanosensitive channel